MDWSKVYSRVFEVSWDRLVLYLLNLNCGLSGYTLGCLARGPQLESLQCQFFSFNLNDLLIASGTIWCGAGNKAKTCDDLGEYAETDKCCKS